MNTLWIDVKYANLLSTQLELFKIKKTNPYLANFRCPICGDSKKNKSKTRGYILQHKTYLVTKCHNCGISMGFSKFLESINSNLHSQYKLEKFKESGDNNTKQEPDITKFAPPKFISNTVLKKLKKISQLAHDHPAKLYIQNRMIPANQHYKLFYCPKFNAFVNEFLSPGMFDENALKNDEPRLIIPFLNKSGNLFAIQGRSFRKDGLRYITIKIDIEAPLIYNIDTVDESDTVYCVEGPIDSMFIPNSIAVGGADLKRVGEVLTTDNIVYVFDNQPRNKEIVNIIKKSCDAGHRVVVWPDNIIEKDINEMIMNGHSQSEILDIINYNTHSGLGLKMKLNAWSKC